MLSKRSEKLLKWLNRHDQWLTEAEIKQKYKKFDDRVFKAITQAELVDKRLGSESDEWIQYRIKDAGIAYLQRNRRNWWIEFRAWVTLMIAIAAFVQSVIALLMQS